MPNAKHSRDDYAHSIDGLKKQFDATVQLLEQQNFGSSAETAGKLMKNMAEVIDSLIKDYGPSLHAFKFPKMDDIEASLEEFKNEKRGAHLSKYADALVRLNKYIHIVEGEVKKNYPVEPAWIKFVGQKKKEILLGLAGLIVLSIPVFVFRYLESQKHGLRGQYFAKASLVKLYRQRVDGSIDFIWGMGSPFPKWKKDGFSVRWTGFLRVPEDGVYEFYTHSDDGVKLFIGEEEIISNWTSHNTSVNKARVLLKQAYYPIRVEFFENKRKATVRLLWRPEGEPRSTVIPAKFLVPSKELLKSDIPLMDKGDLMSSEPVSQEESGEDVGE